MKEHNVVQTSRPVPSFAGLKAGSEAASRAKRANRKRDTKPELLLRRALWALGLRYRKHVSSLPGNPDLVFKAACVVVFCDGDFWHGRDWPTLRAQLRRRHNSDYWIAKIGRNRERDAVHTARLIQAGWLVLRVWGSDVVRDPIAIAAEVKQTIERQHGQSSGSAAASREEPPGEARS